MCTLFADYRSAGETTTRHLSRYYGSRFSASFQAPGVTDLRVRVTSPATRWFTLGNPTKAENFKSNCFD
jgi:hypothetical protein